jgi:hypothetical protein
VGSAAEHTDGPVVASRTTVNGLLSAIQAQNAEWEFQLPSGYDGHLESMVGHISGSTDSGLQVNDSSASGETPQKFPQAVDQRGASSRLSSDNVKSNVLVSTRARHAENCLRDNELMHHQHCSSSCHSDDSQLLRSGTDVPPPPQMCSVAVNTTLYWPPPNHTGPEVLSPDMGRRSTFDSGTGPDMQLPETNVTLMASSTPNSVQDFGDSGASPATDHYTVPVTYVYSENGRRRVSVTVKEAVEQRQTEWDDTSPDRGGSMADVSNYTPPPPVAPNPSEESVISEMIMDMPEYSYLSPEKTELFGEFNNSSHHEIETEIDQQNLNDSWMQTHPGAHASKHKQYMQPEQPDTSPCTSNNISQQAGNLSFGSDRSGSVVRVSDAIEHCKAQLLQMNMDGDESWQEPSADPTFNTCVSFDETVMLDTAVLPKLNYVSMVWDRSVIDSRSPADTTSVVNAVNAAALKYLDDQQLVQQAAAAANRRHARMSPTIGAQRPLPSASAGVSNASIYGVKSANMSLASRRYFEKHHLAAGDRLAPNTSEHFRDDGRNTSSRSKVENLLISITSQVNNLQTVTSPQHIGSCDGDRQRFCLDTSGMSVGRQLNQSDRVVSADETEQSSNCHRDSSFSSSRRSLSAVNRSVLSDTTLNQNYTPVPSSQQRSSLDGSLPRRLPLSHHGQLRAIDRTLEFAGDVVVDSSGTPRSQWH